jgi:4-diphosphocytidyl-2-C-methyl-D-erythritol kinase
VAEMVRLHAPAKINLRLCVLARESSGFHSLETVFCATSLVDEVTVRRAGPGIALEGEGGADMGPAERNLAVRAAERFYRQLRRPPAIAIRLHKRIPAAAGLGGGSSDAAAVLRALNTLHRDPFPAPALLQTASEIGSDVPFFLCGSPLALGWGRGERLLPLPPLPGRPLLIAHPGVAMPTGTAFQRLARLRGTDFRVPAAMLSPETLGSWRGISQAAINDFEDVADDQVPLLPEARELMREAGAEIALLSGSGASLFGVFATPAQRERAEATLRQRGMALWRAETLQTMPMPQVDPSPNSP